MITRNNRTYLSVIFTLLSCALPASSQAIVYKDWEVACNNISTCTALGFFDQKAEEGDTDPDGGYIAIERLGGPSAIPSITLHLPDGLPLSSKKQENITFIVDGKKLFSADVTVTHDPDDAMPQLLPLPNDKVILFLAGIRNGKTLIVSINKNKLITSLNGVAAALLKMDDVQKRIGTTTALIHPGSNPTSSVPEPAKMPVITRAKIPEGLEADQSLASKLRDELTAHKTLGCDDMDAAESAAPDEVDALSTTLSLVGLVCYSGAYQQYVNFWFVKNGDVKNAQPVNFKLPVIIKGTPEGDATDNRLGNPDFDPKDSTITFAVKDSGAGGCGQTGTYAWTGTSFELCSYEALETCRGLTTWPSLWKADCGIK